MTERAQWPTATADLFTDAAGIAAYIDAREHPDVEECVAHYRRDMAALEADPDPAAARLLAKVLREQRGAVTAWLDALVHLGAARWEYACETASHGGYWRTRPCGMPEHVSVRRFTIYGPVEKPWRSDAPPD